MTILGENTFYYAGHEIRARVILEKMNDPARFKIGQVIGRLTITAYLGHGGRTDVMSPALEHYYLADCQCGTKDLVIMERATKNTIRVNGISSCGCYKIERTARLCYDHPHEPVTKNKYVRGEKSINLLATHWSKMNARCYNPNDNNYRLYGARGITVCYEWRTGTPHAFDNFCDWMYKEAGYRDEYAGIVSIDRINNDKGYSPDNCILSFMTAQGNNTRNTNKNDWYGQIYSDVEFARRFGYLRRAYNHYVWELGLFTPQEVVDCGDLAYIEYRQALLDTYGSSCEPYKLLPFDYIDYADVDPRDPRRYYMYPRYEMAMRNIALQARFTAAENGYPVKPFEFTNSGSDDFLGYNQYMPRM